MLQVGDKVSPKTSAGLWLSEIPCDGTYNQKSSAKLVFKGIGEIIEVQDIVIDYDTWDEEEAKSDDYTGGYKIGKVPYRNCLVKCKDGIGWAGEGALIRRKNASSKNA